MQSITRTRAPQIFTIKDACQVTSQTQDAPIANQLSQNDLEEDPLLRMLREMDPPQTDVCNRFENGF